jgi:uncharacterized membrane protein YhaH (DUF805 family)
MKFEILWMKYLVDPIVQSFDYKSHSTRKQFWLFLFISYCLSYYFALFDRLLFQTFEKEGVAYGDSDGYLISYLVLLLVIPGLSIAIRRLRDGGTKGLGFLLLLIPFLNFILLCRPSRKS